MAIQDISNLAISASFQSLLQVSGSQVGTAVGDIVTDLDITSSFATTASFVESALSSSHADAANTAGSASFATTALSATSADSASVATTADSATSASYATNSDIAISASFATTASHALNVITVDTGSLLQTASISDATITFEKADGSTFDLTVDNVASASYALSSSRAVSSSRSDSSLIADSAEEIFVYAKNVQGASIPKGYAVHSSGVTGENVNITTASYDDSSLMPAIGITQTAINAGAVGEVIISGRLKDVNTSNLVAGASVYVNGDGSLTATRPTGSALVQNIGVCAKVNATEGEIIVMGAGRSNDVPNIATGAVWVGNDDQVATAVQTGSLSVATASFAESLATGIDINVNSISASNATFQSASIGYLESVTGSAKIIGDAFIILNNNTPSERYAGVSVYDSGSANNTSSFVYDGNTDDWFFEKDVLGSAEFGIAMFGPEYSTKGSPTYLSNNTIPKGGGGHHLNDSNITDDGTTIVLGSSTQVTGSLDVSLGITGDLTGNASTATSASHAVQADSALTANTASYVAALNIDGVVTSASHAVSSDTALTANTASYVAALNVDGTVASASFAVSASSVYGSQTIDDLVISGSAASEVQALTTSGAYTASLDMSTGNFFTLNLTTGQTTHVDVTNPQVGQTVNVEVTQPLTTGSISFSSNITQPSGSAYAVSSDGGDIDVLTLVSFDGETVRMVATNKFV